MTREEIIELALDAGVSESHAQGMFGFIERFASLVAAKERERWCISCSGEEDANAAVEEAYEAYGKVKEALSTPPSTTALQELITEVERRTIERCAKAADELRHTDGFSAESADWCSGTIHSAYAIRALPTGNLKLEDLK